MISAAQCIIRSFRCCFDRSTVMSQVRQADRQSSFLAIHKVGIFGKFVKFHEETGWKMFNKQNKLL